MRELYVANNGRSPPEWEVKVFPDGYYLRGQQNTYYGFGKVVLSCVNKRVILMSVYSAGDKSLTIAKGGWTHALRIDGEEISLSEPKLVDIYAKDDNIISSFALEKLQINKILKAKSIGHSMKPSSMAAFYVGYDVDIDDADRAKVRDYILNCK